jgi:DNA replication protein DnaC
MKERGKHSMWTDQQENRKVMNIMQPEAVPLAPHKKECCERCKDVGYLRVTVPFGHPLFGKPIRCQCKEAERIAQRRQQLNALSDLGVLSDKRLENYNFRIPGTQEAFRAASIFAHSLQGWLVLIGGCGSGKTHLAAAIANHCLEQERVVLFMTTSDLLDHLRSTFAPTSTVRYDQRFLQMREAELLILDDFVMEPCTSWAREKLCQLLNSRYVTGLPTVVTMNQNGQESLDEGIRSRLSDQSLVKTVVLNHVGDYRLSEHSERDFRERRDYASGQ